MSAISVITAVPAMSSREIASLVNTTHDSVLRTIRELKSRGVVSPTETQYQNDQNKQYYPEFRIGKRDALVIASGYSVELRAKIIDRLEELESKNNSAFQVPNNFAEALRLAADQQEIIQQQAAQIEQSKPMLLVYDALANRRMDCNTTTLAKQLGTTATKLNTFLKSIGVKFKHQDLPMASHSEWFNVVTGVAKNGYETIQCLITPAGQIEITKLWSEK